MKKLRITPGALSGLGAAALMLGSLTAGATEPCDDFGECKVLIETNATDGDIGFHFLGDGDDLVKMEITGPDGIKVFSDKAKGPLREQKLTETFAESAEPLCWPDPEAVEEAEEEGEELEIVTLADFVDLWPAGTYVFSGLGEEGEMSFGSTDLSYLLPPAPADVDFDGSVVSWAAGDDLGNCTPEGDYPEGVELAAENQIASYEVVLEPDVEDGDPTGALVFSIRVPGDIATKQVTVPADYLAALPADTPVKVEVGAIGMDDNATFSEEDGFCVNEVEGCEDE